MPSLFSSITHPSTPGLFIAGTDTDVGKTVVACLIADQFRRSTHDITPRSRIGVFKPIATGCRREREGLVADDAEQLAHAADFDPDVGDLTTINPVRFRPPVAPAAAITPALGARAIDVEAIQRALERQSDRCAAIIVEGIGGVMVPIAPNPDGSAEPYATTLDLMAAIGYPVVVVCRAGLGTLNHTALTVSAIRAAGLTLAGLVVNGYDEESADASMQTNRDLLARQNRTQILATLPRNIGSGSARRPIQWNVRAIEPALREAIDTCSFSALCRPGRSPGPAASSPTAPGHPRGRHH